MVGVVSVYLDTGGTDGTPGTSTDVDALGPPSIRFKTADNPTIDTASPVPIPATAGPINYSYIKSLYIKCDTAPDTQIDNFRFYTEDAGGFGTGITTYVGDQFPNKSNLNSSGYKVATGTINNYGTEMTVNHPGVTTKTNAFSFTAGTPLSGPTISADQGSIINASGETTNYLIVQANVISTASPGNKPNLVWYFIYDEI